MPFLLEESGTLKTPEQDAPFAEDGEEVEHVDTRIPEEDVTSLVHTRTAPDQVNDLDQPRCKACSHPNLSSNLGVPR